jgi:hypothetical protein
MITCLDLLVWEPNQFANYEPPLPLPGIHQMNLRQDISVCLVMNHARAWSIFQQFVPTLYEFKFTCIRNGRFLDYSSLSLLNKYTTVLFYIQNGHAKLIKFWEDLVVPWIVAMAYRCGLYYELNAATSYLQMVCDRWLVYAGTEPRILCRINKGGKRVLKKSMDNSTYELYEWPKMETVTGIVKISWTWRDPPCAIP